MSDRTPGDRGRGPADRCPLIADRFWSEPADTVLAELGSSHDGLSPAEAAARRGRGGRLRPHRRSVLRILAAQFLNPLVLMLLVAAAVSTPIGEVTDSAVLLGIVLLSGGLGFVQEFAAEDAVARLLAMVRTRACVRRGGRAVEVDLDDVVPGDVVLLSAGATVPGDARIIAQNGLQVDESALTGESFPAAKQVEPVPPDVGVLGRKSAVFLGTHVVSGSAEAVVVAVGEGTELGHISGRLAERRPPTDFDIGLQRFGTLLLRVSAVMVLVVFAVNIGLHRGVIEAFLFSVALAVGLVPELLPAIVTVNLARGARRMAEAEVVVKRLAGIEDLGAVDVLCSDKTGTLTEGHIRLGEAYGPDGRPSARARELGWLNATFESGYDNPIDAALRDAYAGDRSPWTLLGEVPYDFTRKRLSVVLGRDGRVFVVTKGQLECVLAACTHAEEPDGSVVPLAIERIRELHARLAEDGMRVLGVAIREVEPGSSPTPALERDMTFAGLLALTDPPKADVPEVLRQLDGLHVALKILTGDDHRVATHLWRTVRGRAPVVMTGPEIHALGTEALQHRARRVDVFAEVDPSQKERIVAALRHAGHVVAYLGDGINDAPALRAADVGLSVDEAADVAREAADVVLRRRDLGVVANGLREGRRTMANTLKYVYYTSSSNFGNMLSMAAASLFLPFLPLTATQILLNNFLADVPAMTIAGDRVDPEQVTRPGRWRTEEIRSFMFVFGCISSLFDGVTFLLLFALSEGNPAGFRTGWFTESLLTEVFVLWVMRTRRPVWRSRPAPGLLWSSIVVATFAVTLPWTPLAALFGFVPLPAKLVAVVVGITVTYVLATELAKRWFFRHSQAAPRTPLASPWSAGRMGVSTRSEKAHADTRSGRRE
jgi:Mg2+-importing ATPase